MFTTRPPEASGCLPRLWGAFGAVLGAVARWVGWLLAWALLLGAVALWWASRPPPLQARTVLVIAPQGPLVEQPRTDTREALLARVQGTRPSTALPLQDLLRALEHAAQDPDISSVLLRLDGLSGGGLALQREAAAALLRFRASGKKVLAWAQDYDQRAWYIAAHADEVYLSPMGSVQIRGYGRWRNYYRDALDRLGVQVQLVRAGDYKNAAEPWVANAPSPQTQASDAALQQALWRQYQAGAEKARRWPAGHLDRLIDSLPDSLAALGGDPARWALDHKLVDGLMTPDALRKLLVDRGVQDETLKSFRQIRLDAYLQRLPEPSDDDAVALVVAEGTIADGAGVDGRVAEQLRRARDDERVKAVLLRVNSPGGSAQLSELIRRELQLTRAAGKPVVASMGDVAASGGYWIAMSADEIIADPATLTGSIGVFGLLPSAAGLMDKLSVRPAGSGTTWLASAGDPRLPPDPRFVQLVQTVVNHLYTDFTTRAAAARQLSRDKLEASAQGQVWTGDQALARGLVDKLGHYGDALAAAKARAKLPATAPVLLMATQPRGWERLLRGWTQDAGVDAQTDGASLRAGQAVAGLPVAALQEALHALALGDDARVLAQQLALQLHQGGLPTPWAHCLCGQPP
jgi:protease IV